MINKLSHATIWVLDQDEALEFYRDKLGFEVKMDATLEGFRWLTLSPKNQKEVEIVLMSPNPSPMMSEETAKQIRALIEKGAMAGGVFQTDDCKATYEELKSRGVEFMTEPAERPYGIEALMKDNSGNWFSVTQPKPFSG